MTMLGVLWGHGRVHWRTKAGLGANKNRPLCPQSSLIPFLLHRMDSGTSAWWGLNWMHHEEGGRGGEMEHLGTIRCQKETEGKWNKIIRNQIIFKIYLFFFVMKPVRNCLYIWFSSLELVCMVRYNQFLSLKQLCR